MSLQSRSCDLTTLDAARTGADDGDAGSPRARQTAGGRRGEGRMMAMGCHRSAGSSHRTVAVRPVISLLSPTHGEGKVWMKNPT